MYRFWPGIVSKADVFVTTAVWWRQPVNELGIALVRVDLPNTRPTGMCASGGPGWDQPYTVIRSTQLLKFLGAIAASMRDGNMVTER